MTTASLMGRDLYMRHTGGDGTSYVTCHRVWDADLFEAAQRQAASKAAIEAGQKSGTPGKQRAERITEEQFKKEHTK